MKTRNTTEGTESRNGSRQDEERERLSAGQMHLREVAKQGDVPEPEKLMVEYLLRREGEVLAGMGAWRGQRDLSGFLEDDNYSFRLSGGGDTESEEAKANIYNRSNKTMGLVRSGLRFVTARAVDDLFGTSPWLATKPEGIADEELAAKLQPYIQWKLGQAKVQKKLESAIDRVFNNGEAILRAGWSKERWPYFAKKNVLVRADGAVVVAPDGDYIFDSDKMVPARAARRGDGWVVVPDPTTEDTEGEDAGGGETSELASAEEGAGPVDAQTATLPVAGGVVDYRPVAAQEPEAVQVMVFEKAPEVVLDAETMRWEEMLIEDEAVGYEGVRSVGIDYRAWRCPMNVECITEGDFRGHVYEMRLSELRAKARDLYGDEEDWPASIVEMLERCLTEDARPKAQEKQETAANQSGAAAGEGDEKNPVIKCLDVEFLWDPRGKGDATWWFATVLFDIQEGLFCCDFLANMLPKGRKSFYSVAAINQKPNEWAGRGWWEVYASTTENTDRMWNAMLVRLDMAANPVTGVDGSAIEEDVKEFSFRPGANVTLKKNRVMSDFIQAFTLPSNEQGVFETVQMVMRLFQLETGVTSAAQGGVGDLPATNTATGIQSVLASGSVLQKRPTNQVRSGMVDHLQTLTALQLRHQDRRETFQYGEGANAVVAEISPEEVGDLEVNVELLLTRFRQKELVENTRAAAEVFERYLALPEEEKGAARGMYIQMLNGLDIQDADRVIRPPIKVQPPSPWSEMKIGFNDLPPMAQKRVLVGMGLMQDDEDMPVSEEAGAGQGSAKKGGKKDEKGQGAAAPFTTSEGGFQ